MGFADNLAKKQFHSPEVQRSWNVHLQAFGPILAPAFADDYQAKIHLGAALNLISRRDIAKGLKKLELIKNRCRTQADEAAWLFFMGLCFDMAGREPEMLTYYRLAGERGHKFYMPHLRCAKFYERGRLFDRAVECYRTAAVCFDGMGLGDQEKTILASIHGSLASCYTQMHYYEMAERAMHLSRQFQADAPGRSMVEALLHAAQGREGEALAALEVLKAHAPESAGNVETILRGILAGTDPMYCPVPISRESLDEFWSWFRQGALQDLDSRLNELFPYAEGSIEAGVCPQDGEIWLPHFYILSLERGFEALVETCPVDLREEWTFVVCPYLSGK